LDTKLKGWTAVRIICFILILALCFLALNRVLSIAVRYDETGVTPDVVFSDVSSTQHFFDRNMSEVIHQASLKAYFMSENHIRAGRHLMWFEHTGEYREYHYPSDFHEYSDEYGDEMWTASDENNMIIHEETWSELKSPDGEHWYSSIEGSVHSLSNMQRRIYEQDAIQNQLYTFRAVQEALDNKEGLIYFISIDPHDKPADHRSGESATVQLQIDENRLQTTVSIELDRSSLENVADTPIEQIIYSNVEKSAQTIEHFKSQPAYFIEHIISGINTSGTAGSEQSHYLLSHEHFFGLNSISSNADVSIFLAFTQDAINSQSAIYASARTAYILDFSLIAASAVLILGLLILLLVSAGKENIRIDGVVVKSESIHFSALDKPYLDISFALIAAWTILMGALSLHFGTRIAYDSLHGINIAALNILFAVALLLTLPLLLHWLMTCTKRVKAGRFWKHTLIYKVLYNLLYGALRFCVRKIRALWAGTRLTARVVLISLISFFILLVVGVAGLATSLAGVFFVSLPAAIAIAVMLLRYAGRINNLEQGARKVSEGNYDAPIDAGGGELGSIAGSINNISAGINKAVEERMKSERLKTELITNVSHDIRTPLTSIITYTDLLEHEGLDCEKAPEYLDILKQKSLRLKTLTDELFEAAKASTGNIEVNITELNIASLITQVLGELDSAVKSSGLDLRANLPDNLMVRADGRLMQRVMENLLSNVFRYSLPGSRVYLDALPLNALPAGNAKVQIDIKNISSAELNFDPSELTERFKRGDDSRADGGSGLGLSIVQSFISAQGGTFEITIDGDLFKATVLLPAP